MQQTPFGFGRPRGAPTPQAPPVCAVLLSSDGVSIENVIDDSNLNFLEISSLMMHDEYTGEIE